MRVEPDCIGRCTCSHTLSVSAIARITRSLKSFGCGLVKRSLFTPDTPPTARSRSAKSWTPSKYELTVWPMSTISEIPEATTDSVSRITSGSWRLRSGPRVVGTMNRCTVGASRGQGPASLPKRRGVSPRRLLETNSVRSPVLGASTFDERRQIPVSIRSDHEAHVLGAVEEL